MHSFNKPIFAFVSLRSFTTELSFVSRSCALKKQRNHELLKVLNIVFHVYLCYGLELNLQKKHASTCPDMLSLTYLCNSDVSEDCKEFTVSCISASWFDCCSLMLFSSSISVSLFCRSFLWFSMVCSSL